MSDGRLALTIPLKPWFYDHRIGGRAILPAVETMLLLAARAKSMHPETDVRVLEEVRFPSFLELPARVESLTTLVECSAEGDGRIRVKLLSRVQLKGMSRIREHGEIVFSPVGRHIFADGPQLPPVAPTDPVTVIGVDRLYRELVPFGPSYHTLQESLYLSGRSAWGRLRAPVLPGDPIQDLLGSPFPLDGALHAASVLGQQTVDFVPFPVGLARRAIIRPTQPGHCYRTRVRQISGTDEELVFDLEIFDDEGRLYETATGLRMRDGRGTIRRMTVF